MRVNIGCGQTPTKNWRNFDNSFSVRLSQIPVLPALLAKIGLTNEMQHRFIQFARINSVEYGDATKGLPVADGSADVVYSSHMLEHLDSVGVTLFLQEARRILCPGGIIRIAVPDMGKLLREYLESGDADALVSRTLLAQPQPRSFLGRLRMLLFGNRNHQWMYDGASLSRLLEKNGFSLPKVMRPGETRAVDPRDLNLEEKAAESVFVEAIRP